MRVPKELTGEAKDFWQAVAPSLAKSGVLQETDRFALMMLCLQWKLFCDAVATNQRPSVIGEIGANVRQGMKAFGLDPLARKNLEINFETQEKDEYGL